MSTDQVQAEVRVKKGHRLTAFQQSIDNAAGYIDWLQTLYGDSELDISEHFSCFPLQSIQTISRNEREEKQKEWGEHMRFYQLHGYPDQLLAYVNPLRDAHDLNNKVSLYQIPFGALLFQEWSTSQQALQQSQAAFLFVGNQQASLFLFQDRCFLNQATIQFRTPEDILYHFLFSLDQFSIEPSDCSLTLMGPQANSQVLIDLFQKQIRLDQEFMLDVEDDTAFELKLLWKCAS